MIANRSYLDLNPAAGKHFFENYSRTERVERVGDNHQ